MDLLGYLWTAFVFVAGIFWSLIWFVLRDVVSTILWLLIIAWVILGVRYRSFSTAALAIIRYGGYGLGLFWIWLRGGSAAAAARPPSAKHSLRKARRQRAPFGYMSVSDQFNMILVGMIFLLILG